VKPRIAHAGAVLTADERSSNFRNTTTTSTEVQDMTPTSKSKAARCNIMLPLAAALLATQASAAPLYCVGAVNQLFSRSDGELSFKAGYRGDFVTVCNLQAAWNGIAQDQCKNWYATLLAAQLSGSPVTIYYPNSQGYAACAVVPTYSSAPVPGYVLLGDALQ